MTLQTAALIVYYYLIALGFTGVALYIQQRVWDRFARRDEHRGADEAYADQLHEVRMELAGEVLDVQGVPIVGVRAAVFAPSLHDGSREWQIKRRRFADFLAAENLTAALLAKEPPPPRPALYKSHRSDDTAATPLGYQPRHLSLGPRDPAMDALLTTTAIFDAIAEHEGAPVREHGPREDEIRCVRQGSPAWQQATLELGALR